LISTFLSVRSSNLDKIDELPYFTHPAHSPNRVILEAAKKKKSNGLTLKNGLSGLKKQKSVIVAPATSQWNGYCLYPLKNLKFTHMNIFNWIGLTIVSLPVFFIIRTSISMIRDKRLN